MPPDLGPADQTAGVADQLSQLERPAIEIALSAAGREAARIEELASGRSGASKYRVETPEGESVFVKIAMADAGERQRHLLRREVSAVSQLRSSHRAPRLIGVIDTEAVTATVSEWIDGASSSVWTAPAALAAVEAVRELRRELLTTELKLRRLSDDGTRFRTFAEEALPSRAASLDPGKVAWLSTHRDQLAELERDGCARMRSTGLLHCDLAADNVLLPSSGQAVLVDWSHAALGDPAFDLAALCIRVHADDAVSPQFTRAVEELSDPSSWVPMLVLVTGMFLEVSRGEQERPSASLSAERARFSEAGVSLIQEALS